MGIFAISTCYMYDDASDLSDTVLGCNCPQRLAFAPAISPDGKTLSSVYFPDEMQGHPECA